MNRNSSGEPIMPYTCYYTTTGFAHAIALDVSCAVENKATEKPYRYIKQEYIQT